MINEIKKINNQLNVLPTFRSGLIYHSHIRTIGYTIGYYLAIKHVKYWRQIYSLISNLYLCNIRSPFLVGPACLEVPFKHIGSNSANFAPV